MSTLNASQFLSRLAAVDAGRWFDQAADVRVKVTNDDGRYQYTRIVPKSQAPAADGAGEVVGGGE